MGVGHSQRGSHAHDNAISWVLGGFNASQKQQLDSFIADAADAAEMIIFKGIEKTQEQFNGRR